LGGAVDVAAPPGPAFDLLGPPLTRAYELLHALVGKAEELAGVAEADSLID
jgi:hypothetical protein